MAPSEEENELSFPNLEDKASSSSSAVGFEPARPGNSWGDDDCGAIQKSQKQNGGLYSKIVRTKPLDRYFVFKNLSSSATVPSVMCELAKHFKSDVKNVISKIQKDTRFRNKNRFEVIFTDKKFVDSIKYNGIYIGGKQILGEKDKKRFVRCYVPNFSIFGDADDVRDCFEYFSDVIYIAPRTDPASLIPIGGWNVRIQLHEGIDHPPLQLEFEGQMYNILWPGRPDTRKKTTTETPDDPDETSNNTPSKTSSDGLVISKEGEITSWREPQSSEELQKTIEALNQNVIDLCEAEEKSKQTLFDLVEENMDTYEQTSTKRPLSKVDDEEEDGFSSSRTLTADDSDAEPPSSPSSKKRRKKKKHREKSSSP